MADRPASRLLATSDLHISHRANRAALAAIGRYPDDWLIVAGDIGEKPEHLAEALQILTPRFARVLWVPGNHDLWCPPGAPDRTRGQARYDELVSICRSMDVLTPEDQYPLFPGTKVPGLHHVEVPGLHRNEDAYIVPMFLLFDYTFRPSGMSQAEAIRWARETGVLSGDEWMLDPAPWPSIGDWCHDRVRTTAARLDALPAGARTILVNHWPLRYDLARPPRIPRFSVWCGTTRTEDWGVRYRATAVVSGHLHLRTTLWRYGVRYEEVSLGYPRDWRAERGIDWYLREILPGTSDAARFVPPRDPFLRAASNFDL